MGKITITDSPPALPGSCFNCGSGTREWYADFDLFLDFHGRLYLCNLCVIECAGHAGYVEPNETIKVLEQRLLSATREKAELLERLENVNRALSSVGAVVSGNDSDNSVDLPDVPESDEGTDEVHGEDARQLHLGEGETPEPSNEQGLANVFSFTDESGRQSL